MSLPSVEVHAFPGWPDEVPTHPTASVAPSLRSQSDDEGSPDYDDLFGSTESALAFAEEDEPVAPPGTESARQPSAESAPLCAESVPPPLKAQPLAILRLSTGLVVELDRGVLLGRAPRVESDQAAPQPPRLVLLVSRDNDISRNHAEVFRRGRRVMVQDLGSTNGTTVSLPGQQSLRLRPNDPQVIEPGSVVVLANEISFTLELED